MNAAAPMTRCTVLALENLKFLALTVPENDVVAAQEIPTIDAPMKNATITGSHERTNCLETRIDPPLLMRPGSTIAVHGSVRRLPSVSPERAVHATVEHPTLG